MFLRTFVKHVCSCDVLQALANGAWAFARLALRDVLLSQAANELIFYVASLSTLYLY